MSDPKAKVTVEDVDDLDDLVDNVLDDFSRPPTPPQAAKASSGSTDDDAPEALSDQMTEDFARQLAEEMERLWTDVGGAGQGEASTDLPGGMTDLLRAFGQPTPTDGPSSPAKSPQASASGAKKSFKDKTEETMNRLRESSDQASKAAESPMADEEAMIREMMRQMEQMAGGDGLSGDAGDGPGGLDSLMEGVISQLMTKEVLYEPMRELSVKYPSWLEEKKTSISVEEHARYSRQSGYIRDIVLHFESPDAKGDADPVIADLMEKMQDCGQPPPELLQDLAPGMEMDEDGKPAPPNCSIM